MNILKKLFGSKENANQQSASENLLETYKKVPWMTEARLETLSICLDAGFKPASSLPTEFDKQMRPSIEIAKRLNALKALILWVMVPESNIPSERIVNFVDENELQRFMTDEEKKILSSSRDDDECRNTIGWKFENAWPLAWYFGYHEPEINGQMMTAEQIQDILLNYSCPFDETIENWTKNKETISEESLIKKEDLFYCLHNAVISAQLGRNTVPPDFDPVENGGAIHERRHSLTWMLSKGIDWDDTDLGT
ncbi:MAG TPA: hypothetical protein DIW47_04790 [Bacteroidetes bacterium]|nr:hypothetical protein [Bacteroidota bacterium]